MLGDILVINSDLEAGMHPKHMEKLCMISIRKSSDRGKSETNWLNSFHTFSFADYYDPEFMGFGNLRVINEDTVQPDSGFPRHPHRNMEIISYIVEGSLKHQDSEGNSSVIKPGEIQIMTAGTGVEHSEFNNSKTDLLHFLQIWIIPTVSGLKPSYQQKVIQKSSNQFILIGAQNAQDNAVTIHQDVNLYAAFLTQNHFMEYALANGRSGWLQLIKGEIKLNDQKLLQGDGAAIRDENIKVHCTKSSELLFFDLGAS